MSYMATPEEVEHFKQKQRADRRAKKLAIKTLEKDWTLLQTRKFLRFTIKIKKGKRIEKRKMLMSRDGTVYGWNKRHKKYERYCTILVEDRNSLIYEDNVYPEAYYGGHVLSVYDKIICVYYWFKLYAKEPVDNARFKEQFNLINGAIYPLREIKQDGIRR